MTSFNTEQPNRDREALRMQANQEELVERIKRAVPEDGTVEVLPGLFFHHYSTNTRPNHGVSEPAFCVIAQGSKEVMLGDKRYQYDQNHYLLVTLEMPTVSRVIEASKEKPYLAIRLQLDPNLVSSVIVEAGDPKKSSKKPVGEDALKGLNINRLDASLQDTVVRLVRLVESPDEARILAPLVTREIIYRLLLTEQSERLRYLVGIGGNLHRIVKVMERLRDDYDKPLRIEDMAQDMGMSVSGLHHHFKAVTAMSPIQFQKQLRLREARRLMLTEKLDAASAGFRVGYDNAAHFSREYKSSLWQSSGTRYRAAPGNGRSKHLEVNVRKVDWKYKF